MLYGSEQGTFGPFTPNMPIQVPLWLAVFLHKREKCQVEPPAWMALQVLQGALTCCPEQTAALWSALATYLCTALCRRARQGKA